LMQAIDGLDPVRARLLVEHTYKNGQLGAFADIPADQQERITYLLGNRYERLRSWLESCQENTLDLDHFMSKLFGEILSQPGFGFHTSQPLDYSRKLPLSFTAGQITANLIESIQKYRSVIQKISNESVEPQQLGLDYIQMVQTGVLAAQYIRSWIEPPEESVLLAPAYTFLLESRPVDYQFWLDIGNRSWSERLSQPLTHPFVLNKSWPIGKPWTDLEEMFVNQQIVHNLIAGLLRRCRKRVYLGICNLGEQGFEQRGPLMNLFQQVMFTENEQWTM